MVSVGKIGDIFAHRATGREIKPGANAACLQAGLDALADLPEGGLIFVNLVDFDTEHGHRRDVPATPPSWRRSTPAFPRSWRRFSPETSR